MKHSALPRRVTLGLIQTACQPDPRDNLERTLAAAARAARDGAQILCTQELFQSRYFCQQEDPAAFALAEPIPGPATNAVRALARRSRVVVVASLFERRAPGLHHNTAIVVDADGSLLGRYRKMHIPDDPLYYEKYYFAPGDLGFRTWTTRCGQLGVLICWDQWYPEAARLTALQGAQVLFYPTAIGWHPAEKSSVGPAQHQAWETIQRAHAIANGCYVAAVNRVGLERPAGGDGLEFWGQSFVAGPDGQVLARASSDRDETLLVEVDLQTIETQRVQWPFLRDRRVDAYADLTQRYLDAAPDGGGRNRRPHR
ncbi:MAG TPA: carbon-nitrogen hydrolase [Verrucomicrobiota bacterium]|nr:carbon-nitrogen hydrolase [Verrucomicrobiota bacterium]HNU49509.1 carbon-nitrogen hydrolase [Verrucomicrobiota bacterium]